VTRVSLEQGFLLPRLGAPDPRRAVRTPGEDALAVGAESHAIDRTRVSLEEGLLLPGLGVPDPRCAVPTPGKDALAIGAESDVCDSLHGSLEGSLKGSFSEPESANVAGLPNVLVFRSHLLEQGRNAVVILLLPGPQRQFDLDGVPRFVGQPRLPLRPVFRL